MKKLIFFLAFFVFIAIGRMSIPARMANITVCATGCTFNNTQLQSAINAAVAGDKVLLQQNFTYFGEFELPSFVCAADDSTCYVTIATGVTSTGTILAESVFPEPNLRVTPAIAEPLYATLISTVTNVSAIRTQDEPVVPKWWKLHRLQFEPNPTFTGAFVELGDDASGAITSTANIPSHFIIDQCFFKGDLVKGQYRGVNMLANDVTLTNSYFKDIKSLNEGQSVWINSAEGPFHIENNYLEGGTEVVLSGGSGGSNRQSATLAAATTTSATFSHHNDLHVGQWISVEVATVEQSVRITSCGTAVDKADCTSNNVVWTPATTATPDMPGDADWGVRVGAAGNGLTFIKNHVLHQPIWRDPFIGTPSGVSATPSSTGGTLAAGTYFYKVVARHEVGFSDDARSLPSTEVSAVTTGTTGSVNVCWNAVANAEEYYIYGRNSGAQNVRFSVVAPTTCFLDTGGAGVAENVTTTGSKWLVKNIFELKNMYKATVEGNVFDYAWKDGQDGYAILFTPGNTGGTNDSVWLFDILFRDNKVRHAAGGFQITGRHADSGAIPSGRTEKIWIFNNIFEDISSTWGASARTVIISTAGSFPLGERAPKDIQIVGNTFLHQSGNAMIYLDLIKSGVDWKIDGFTWSSNIGRKVNFGLFGTSCSQGQDCWDSYTTIINSQFQNNVIADATCSIYPETEPTEPNFCPTSTELNAEFIDYAGGNFNLKPTSDFFFNGIGANVGALEFETNIALSGDNTGGGGGDPEPPTITTATLDDATLDAPYSDTVIVSGGTLPYTWSILSGSLPPGLTLANFTGVISGTPTSAGLFTFTINVTDANSLSTTREFNINVEEIIFPAPRPAVMNWQELIGFRRVTCPTDLALDINPVQVGDICSDLTTGKLKIATSTSPTVVWSLVGEPAPVTSLFVSNSANFVWALTALADQYSPSNDIFMDLTGKTECRIFMRTSDHIDGIAWVRFNTANATTATDLGTTAETPQVSMQDPPDGIMALGAWTPIVESAKTFVRLGLWGRSPSATANNTVRNIGIICR